LGGGTFWGFDRTLSVTGGGRGGGGAQGWGVEKTKKTKKARFNLSAPAGRGPRGLSGEGEKANPGRGGAVGEARRVGGGQKFCILFTGKGGGKGGGGPGGAPANPEGGGPIWGGKKNQRRQTNSGGGRVGSSAFFPAPGAASPAPRGGANFHWREFFFHTALFQKGEREKKGGGGGGRGAPTPPSGPRLGGRGRFFGLGGAVFFWSGWVKPPKKKQTRPPPAAPPRPHLSGVI